MNSVDTTGSLQGKSSEGSPTSVSVSRGREDREDRPTPPLEKLYRGVTSPLRLLPDFLIIGAQRGGTTSLYHYLRAHPAVHSTSTKDTHFFDQRFHKGVSWYGPHFPTSFETAYGTRFCHQHLVTGEHGPSYR